MIKAVVLVPLRDNDGRTFPRSAWRDLEARLQQFGGFTRFPDVIGVWQASGGQLYRDRSRHYMVSLVSWRLLPAWLKSISWAQDRFAQEAMYVEIGNVPEVIDFRMVL